MVITPVIAQVTSFSTIAQIQQSPLQLVNQAQKLYQLGQFSEAAELWKKTADTFAAKGDKLNQAMALSNLALTYEKLGQWEPAKAAIAESLAILKIQPDSREKLKALAQTLDIQGYLQRETGQGVEALDTWQQATEIYRQIGDRENLDRSKINQAKIMQELGMHPRSCKLLLEVFDRDITVKDCQQLGELTPTELTATLQKIENKPPALTTATGLRSLGDLLRFVGNLEQSEIILASSLNVAQKSNNSEEQAATYLSIGNTAQALAEREQVRRKQENYRQKALNAYSQAAKLSPSVTTQQEAQLNQLSLLVKLQKYSEAEELWRSLSSQLASLPPSHSRIYLQINFARSSIETFSSQESAVRLNFREIDNILANAAQQARILGDKRAEAYALGNRGRLYELPTANRDLSQAEKFTRDAIGVTSSFTAPDIAYQFFWQLGRIHQAQGDTEGAIAAYTKSFNALQSLRGDLVAINPEVQFNFRESVEPVYRQLVELDLQFAAKLKQAGKDKESQKYLTQARTVIESLQLAELNNFFREACVEANPKQIDKIDRNAAVIYPIILSDRLEVILSLPDREPSFYTTQVSQQQLEEKVERLQRSLLSSESIVSDFLPLYQEAYNWLIQPLEAELANSQIETLVFVLDGDLRNIPMAVLHDGKQYLVEKYAIALTPGLQLLNPQPVADIKLTALTAGLSKIRQDFELHQGFDNLDEVPIELRQIQEIGLSDRSLLDETFTSSAIEREIIASRFPVVHLATHAQFSSKAENTFILSWDNRININQLRNLLRSDKIDRRIPIELLVLSACQTASGDKRATLGLAGIAVRSGARSTLATLWQVVDPSTARIMSEFYRQLQQAKKIGINKAEALRQAQRTLINDEKYSHPHFWAAFVLVGNWQ
ncbi:MAG: CHAT domain-containing protein [Cyanosarcina radialis HA8281-LM2]|jgi:CHAT domain-containing protein|nr:CHAT domain-containing protein [Cyanosarcina radialis HA8281-LM2]